MRFLLKFYISEIVWSRQHRKYAPSRIVEAIDMPIDREGLDEVATNPHFAMLQMLEQYEEKIGSVFRPCMVILEIQERGQRLLLDKYVFR